MCGRVETSVSEAAGQQQARARHSGDAMRVGQARRRDANEPEIFDGLTDVGINVWRVSVPGFPDLITESRGIWLPIEVKVLGGHLTPLQEATRQRVPFPVVETLDEALALFNRVRWATSSTVRHDLKLAAGSRVNS
jgi:hypothetical protein